MEKLLRTCQIDKLYIIIRPKKGMTEKERVKKIFDSNVSLFFLLLINPASNSQICSTGKQHCYVTKMVVIRKHSLFYLNGRCYACDQIDVRFSTLRYKFNSSAVFVVKDILK
jgi:hypothetical protein